MGMDRKILVLIFIFLIARLIFLFNNTVYWDAAVYTGMGKYIFSFGKAGLWEPSRPLIWPLFLGFFWKLGINPIFFGRILTLFFSIGCVYLTYLVGKDIFNKKTALIAAFFLAFSPIFFYSNTTLLTEIPSLFFALLGIYFFIKKRDVLAGFFIGIAFLTRFYQAFVLAVLIFILYFYKKGSYKRAYKLFFTFVITITPYFLLNKILYNDYFYPLSLQAEMVKNTGWPWFEPFSFYFVNLLKENFLVIFSILGIIIVLKEKDHKKWLLVVLFLVFLFSFSFVKHKEMRFIIIALPYLYLFVAFGLVYFLNLIKNKFAITAILLLFFSFWLIQTSPHLYVNLPEQELTEFQTYLNRGINGKIWISDPRQILFSAKKADVLIYYPTFKFEKAEEIIETQKEQSSLVSQKPEVSVKTEQQITILINTCDIPCNPNDEACKIISQKFFDFVKTLKLEYYRKTNNCEEIIAIK